MKTSRIVLIALLTLGLGGMAPFTQAADKPADKPADKAALKAGKPGQPAKAIAKKGTAKDLDLTAEQKAKVKQLQIEEREKTLALREEFEKKLEAILTPEQMAKFKESHAQAGKTGTATPEKPDPKPKLKKKTAGSTI